MGAGGYVCVLEAKVLGLEHTGTLTAEEWLNRKHLFQIQSLFKNSKM